jgi:heptaprenyl diphosphate synthase
MKVQELLYVSLLTATATILGLIENSFPPFFAFAPGAKIGLPNLIMLIAMFTLSWRKVWSMLVLRLVITALFTGFSVFLYSAAGGVLSLLAMYLIKAFGPKLVSMIGISIAGGFFHNMGQLLVASLIAQTPSVMLYLPWLAFFGLLAGFAIGIGGNLIIKRVQPINQLFIQRNQLWS